MASHVAQPSQTCFSLATKNWMPEKYCDGLNQVPQSHCDLSGFTTAYTKTLQTLEKMSRKHYPRGFHKH